MKTYGMILSLLLSSGLVFSFTIEASASHDEGKSITAADVDPGNEQDMKDFINHTVDQYNQIVAQSGGLKGNRSQLIRELAIFARELGREDGDYRHDEVYVMRITDKLVITTHARYPELTGYKVNTDAGTPLADTFKALLDHEDLAIGAPPVCENYGPNDERVACAAKVKGDFTVDVTHIAGLHHEADLDNLDAAFEEPDCNGLTLDTSAEDVFNDPSDANLEAYVKDVIKAVQKDIETITREEARKVIMEYSLDPTNPADLKTIGARSERPANTRIQERLFCFGGGDLKHKNIYAFIMNADPKDSTVFVNGNDFDLNGTNFELEDDRLPGEKNIAKLFNEKLGDVKAGNSTYVDYHWDDPEDPGDDVENFFEDRKVPGTSPKRSYIEVADLNAFIRPHASEWLFIVGSGIYTEDSDGGCAIAGAGHTSQSTLLNLFLAASVLLSVVFPRKHA